MGCDIHMYIEYKDKEISEAREKRGESEYWSNFGTRFNPGRNYAMFAVLAGVRGNYKDSFEPKGKLPIDTMGWTTLGDATLYITEDEEIADLEGYVTLERAKSWRSCEIYYSGGKPTRVEIPDWHSHSWLTIEELESAYQIYLKHMNEEWPGEEVVVPSEYKAVLAAMKSLAENGDTVRVVFWFDN